MNKAVFAACATFMLFGPSALACSVKPGFMAAGLIRTPGYATSTCGPYYQAFRKGSDTRLFKFLEGYVVKPAQAVAFGQYVESAMRVKGFTFVPAESSSSGVLSMFTNGDRIIVFKLTPIPGNIFVGVSEVR